MLISPLGGWLVSVLMSITSGGEWFKSSTAFNLNYKHVNAAPDLINSLYQAASNTQPSSKNDVYALCNVLVWRHMKKKIYRQTPIQETSSIKSEKSIIKFVSEGLVFAGTDGQT